MEYRGTRCPGLGALGGVPASGPAAALSVRLRLRLPSRVGSAVTPACAATRSHLLTLITPMLLVVSSYIDISNRRECEQRLRHVIEILY